MKSNRRDFLKKAGLASAGSSLLLSRCEAGKTSVLTDYSHLDQMLAQPVLKKELFPDPVIIETLELLRYKDNFICRVRSKGGAEGISVSNNMQMISLYPVFTRRLQPFFPGKDARELEKILEEVYVYQSNYKLQSLALWVPLATIEFAILDMLGKIVNKPTGELIGEIHNPFVSVYQANNFRGKGAEQSVEMMKKNVSETNAKALKFKVGGRMSREEEPPGRSEKLIPLVRKEFGDDMTIYADSNGSYNIEEAIRVGRIMEEYKIDFFEEPVPFDFYEETKIVTDALMVKIAGGEQEPSMHNFRWLIGNGALQVVQPDIFYFGGMIRSTRVARMAAAEGLECVPHVSGSGLGYLYMMHFVSALPNAGPYHEFKGFNKELPLECPTADLTSIEGRVKVPTGPGMGVIIDPSFIDKHEIVTA